MTTNADSIRIMFAGGGTGGHLFPALAIADRLKQLLSGAKKVEIEFVGTKRGLEYRMREKLGYPLHLINVRGLARSLSLTNLLVPFILIGALLRSAVLLGQFQPDLVVGTGGYVAWPVLKMANWKSIPTVLQEQNSFPGITTRQLAGRAKRVYLGFGKAREHIRTGGTVIVTGNPVRSTSESINRETAMKEFGLDPRRKTILILGGSQGARTINRAVLKSLANQPIPDGYQILWQTGRRDYTEVTAEAGKKVCSLFPFTDRMSAVYAAADLAIARAGALTIAELEENGIPSILIPFPHAAGDHQRLNAETYAAGGAAIVVDEQELSRIDLLVRAVQLIEGEGFNRMGRALAKRKENEVPAVDLIAHDIIALLEDREKDNH